MRVVTAKAFDELKAEIELLEIRENEAIAYIQAQREECDELQADLQTMTDSNSAWAEQCIKARRISDAYKTQCEKLLEFLKDVIRNSSDILAKKHCSNGLAEHETWLKKQK